MKIDLLIASVSAVVGFVSIVIAIWLARWVLSQDPGPENIKFISDAIASGAKAYLFRQYRTLSIVLVALAIIIGIGISAVNHSYTLGGSSAAAFIVGALGSMAAGYIGMYVTTRSASRAAMAARNSAFASLRVAWRAGAVMGLSLAGIALFLISALYMGFTSIIPSSWALALVSMAFGASLVTLFMRVGGGIYTKAADLGADLVGKVEKGIPEDDPRNPGVIADNVGDNVGDVAGMAADVFESYIVIVTGAIFLSWIMGWSATYPQLVVLPLLYGALALIATFVGISILRLKGSQHPLTAISIDIYETIAISIALFFIVSVALLGNLGLKVALVAPLAASLGAVVAPLVLALTGYYTHYTYKPVKDIANQALISPATVIVTGYAYGLISAIPVILLIAFVLGLTYALGYFAFSSLVSSSVLSGYSGFLAGIYGTALASVGLLSVAGIIITADSFGPVSDNAAGVAEMASLPEEVRDRLDVLDAVGNTTKATTKGYAISSAAMAALVLFIGFIFEVISVAGKYVADPVDLLNGISVINPNVLIGALIGAVVVYVLASRTLGAVGKTAMEIVEEIRRQFRERPGIMEWKEKPDYARVVDIATRRALQEFMMPVLVAIIAPVAAGLLLGWQAIAGLIMGAILVGVPRALLMANAGGAWDNAKKYIEAGLDPKLGGKGSDAHKAAVVGDTVGDPFKDTTGPSMNPLIKVLNTLSVVFAPMIVAANASLGVWMLVHGLLAL
ncbi:Proton-translocating pyrophosphatase [Acidilobus saccharovorans 345-15]|uniref:K(+)-insensitive pyrophosphate-energized proton pump n=1 Tax=Acidilobus saccharovorans (strain DSM 16705 / JCM 18335 / VKM B-2471 / 345-15) TaxID=666510 RepID=D9Q280_ACIS3|nr:sodium-translocating pyrophosphatase [Acidilobus saccharovorans]ADL19418.1 Proton-translocating pyrophosphatase [Acidilobus saccharovorans 345-15]